MLGDREDDVGKDVRDKTRVQGRDRGGNMAMGEGLAAPTETRLDPATSHKKNEN